MASSKQAVKTSKAEAAGRKVNKMFDGQAEHDKKKKKEKPKKSMATKVPGKMGPSTRGGLAGRSRKTGRATAGGGSSSLWGKGLFNRIGKRI